MKEKCLQYDNTATLIKFGTKSNIKSLQRGCLYMKNLLYYINLEKASSSTSGGQGDMFEGQLVQKDVTIVISDLITNTTLAQTKAEWAAIDFGYQKYPVFCMFMLDSRNLVAQKIEGDKIKSHRFTAGQVNKMQREFGDYALMIDYPKFIQRVKDGLNSANIEYIEGQVWYYEPNDSDYFKAVHNDHLEAVFWKQKSYAFQQEFRILALKKVNDHLAIDIGDISDISLLFKTQDLLNLQIDFVFDV